MSSMWGEQIKISVFGGSHTEAIGVTIDGLPAGEAISMDAVLEQMSRRAPGRDLASTTRKEADVPQVISGLSENHVISGDPLCALIYNTNQRSKDYSELRIKPRPGHADFPASVKFNGCNDIRGGGHFSGRLTAPLVFAGAVCRQILEKKGIYIGAHALSISHVIDEAFNPVTINQEKLQKLSSEYFAVQSSEAKEKMYEEIEKARLNCDSVGGVIECAVIGLPVGLGRHMFGGVENVLSSIIFGVPAVKGIEFGEGFHASDLKGSENNDSFFYDNNLVKAKTNHSGGVLGGMTNGMPLLFKVAMKPTASISQEQKTVNLQTKTDDTLKIIGRHDPCIVPRAIPVIESVTAIAIAELMSRSGLL
ncbi:chorismate synthase [Scatolibacter rhodanostii]|uniref:chorismate synthase n=1 Tax=Scatolibacter rhodanostii TaxID=2014781 RepID=UPI000C07B5A0|nr:chorismate synthase [Scatolibacter rhodanostii]